MIAAALARRSLIARGLALGLLPLWRASAATDRFVWGIDYGAETDPAIARRFDLLVLEPGHARPIAPLRGPGAKLLGYISLGEVERNRPYARSLASAGALRAPNANWPDARYVDLRHRAWKTLVLNQLVPQILAKGYDGIFIDTMDNAEAMERADPKGSAGMVEAGIDLIRSIHKRFPRALIMLNRGYALLPHAAPHIDYLLGEAMASRWNFTARKYEMASSEDWNWQAAQLRSAKRANPSLVVTTLDYWNPADTETVASLYARARSQGFEPYVSTLDLNRLLLEPRS